MMVERFRWLWLIPLPWLMFASPVWSESGWRAGAARVAITPDKPMWMAGYSSRARPAEGKLQELWAKALVLEDAHQHRALLLCLDLVGIDRGLSEAICRSLGETHGWRRQQIAICTSHTHAGPVVGRNLAPLHYLVLDAQQRALVDEYVDTLLSKIDAVVRQAMDRVEPVELSWGSGQASFAVNRRNNRAQQVPRLRFEARLEGPHDHDVPVLAARDLDGRLRAVVFGYACHATVLSLHQWSGDYPGFAQQDLEDRHPDCIAMFFAGCGADQNPLPRRSVELAKHYGRRLSTAVDAVLLTQEMQPLAARLDTRYREVDLPLGRLPTIEELERDAHATDKYVRARAQMLLDTVKDGRSLPSVYPYPVAVWNIGEQLQLVLLGGEVVVDYALRLKAELTGKRTWVAGYANDVMAYIPSRRVLGEGGYEGGGAMVYYGLPTVWDPQVENTIVRTVHDLLQDD